MRTWIQKAWMLVMLLAVSLLARANDGVYYVSGNQIVPLQEADIAVTKEVLTITIGDDEFARVDVQYEFTNRGKAKTIDVGFEATAPYEPGSESNFSKAGQHPDIFDFTVEMNGTKLPIRNYVMRESEEENPADFTPLDLNVWQGPTANDEWTSLTNKNTDETILFSYAYCFRAAFKEGKNTVHHTYRYRISNGVYQTFNVPYWLMPAMRWANHQIDDFTLRIKVEKTAKQFCIDGDEMWKASQWRVTEGAGKVHTLKSETGSEYYYYEFSLRNGTVEWHSANFRPISNFNIFSAESVLFYQNDFKIGRFYDRSTTWLSPGDPENQSKGSTDGIANKRILRNLPYASRGYVFKDAQLKAYFTKLWWYMPDPSWQQDTSDFTESERKLVNSNK